MTAVRNAKTNATEDILQVPFAGIVASCWVCCGERAATPAEAAPLTQ